MQNWFRHCSLRLGRDDLVNKRSCQDISLITELFNEKVSNISFCSQVGFVASGSQPHQAQYHSLLVTFSRAQKKVGILQQSPLSALPVGDTTNPVEIKPKANDAGMMV